MSRHLAYAFKSDLTLGEMFSRLQELGPWRWIERDSDRWDAYISALALDEPAWAMVKIFVEEGFYVVDVLFRSDHPDAQPQYEDVHRTLFERILPAIGGRDIARSDPRE